MRTNENNDNEQDGESERDKAKKKRTKTKQHEKMKINIHCDCWSWFVFKLTYSILWNINFAIQQTTTYISLSFAHRFGHIHCIVYVVRSYRIVNSEYHLSIHDMYLVDGLSESEHTPNRTQTLLQFINRKNIFNILLYSIDVVVFFRSLARSLQRTRSLWYRTFIVAIVVVVKLFFSSYQNHSKNLLNCCIVDP